MYSISILYFVVIDIYSLTGVAINTGKILYECNINECMNHTDRESHMGQEILIIQRLQQTVRAVEPRTGVER